MSAAVDGAIAAKKKSDKKEIEKREVLKWLSEYDRIVINAIVVITIPYIVVVILIVILLSFPDTVRTTYIYYNLCDVYTLFFLYSIYICSRCGSRRYPENIFRDFS